MPILHVLGDSISIHYGPWLERFLVGGSWDYSRKEGPVGDLDQPDGANGGDSARVLTYLRGCRVASRHWDMLLINCGLHDIKTPPGGGPRQIGDEEYRANLQVVVGEAAALADRTVWIATTHVVDAVHNAKIAGFHRHDADRVRYAGIAATVMREAGLATIDLERFTRACGGDEIFCDHVHFTEPVRKAQAAFIAGWVRSGT